MVVRLAFAVVAHIDADVLVIDEALAVGDAFFVQKCMRFLREFMKTGTILFVSHDTGAVVNLCHRAIWLHKGEMMMDGPARDVTEAYLANLAEEAYGVGPAAVAPARSPQAARQPRVAGQRLPARAGQRDDHRSVRFVRQRRGAHRRSRACSTRPASRCRRSRRRAGHAADSLRGSRPPGQSDRRLHRQGSARPGAVFRQHVRPLRRPAAHGRSWQPHRGAFYLRHADRWQPVEYTVGVAIADGTQESHVQHHWIHDALLVTSLTSSAATGLMGIPMREVSLVVERQP